ncbi:MAG TPA: glycogen debranching N-terminal domain-containing protein [Thermoanaerobaculia bacterium]|jgi:glycogen debranching enzyme|nr:glycogen debranching N-terminal domain-containing protein [Thermoanaerobaculia bacterium]
MEGNTLPGDGHLDPFDPAHVVVHQGYSVLVARRDGGLRGEGREGLYDFDTRILCRHRLLLDGREPFLLSSCALAADHWSARLWLPRPGGTAAGPHLPQDALEIAVDRRLGCGMAERLTVRNYGMQPVETELVLELDADFADVQETGGERRQSGAIEIFWDPAGRAVTFGYAVRHEQRELRRGLRVRIAEAATTVVWDQGRLRFPLALPARGSWSAAIRYESLVDGTWRQPCGDSDDTRRLAHQRWCRERACLETTHPVMGPAFERAAEDLFALRAWELDREPDAWVPNAGVPTYTGLFGRDILTAGWQGALIGPEMLRGALAILAETQAEVDSAWREEEPGKMLHEMRRGPLSELEIIPQRAYYGTQTTPAMFVVALSELWHWTGDTAALRRYRDAALRGLDWAARYADRDGDGFLESVQRSPAGLKNHGWKDSDEAIRYADGSLVENPLSTVEEQAFHWMALQRMAEILVALEEDERAEEMLRRAGDLGKRWHEAFWMEEEGFYAMALDGDKRQVRSIGSNPGHALAVGLVPAEHARRVADRLLAPDLFSGWGVRTLSSEHPSYNPLAYHLGTVWPVENATFALAFKRYGFADHLDRLAAGLFDAAAHFHGCRLPETLGGHGREESPVPAIYPGSNCPQAWSASAVVQLVQTLLGVYPFAPARTLALVQPQLPEGVGAVTLRRVRVGDAVVSIRFERAGDGTVAHEVIERQGELLVVSVPPPDDVAPESWTERLARWGLAHAPGRIARAARIAIGQG